ncbi:MAG: hypothetical protein AB7T06_29260 [Kofleriaceae bacterium]
MADPVSPRSAHINGPLSNFASAYSNAQFIADQVSGTVLVEKESDSFHKRTRSDQATIIDDAAGPRASLNEASYDLEEDMYVCRSRGLKQAVPESLMLNADNPPLNPDQLATANVMQRIKLARERRVAVQVMTSGNWATANTGAVSNVWTDEVNGTPLRDMKTGLQAIPFNGDDVLVFGVCSDVVWDDISMHPDMMALRAGGSTKDGTVSPEELAKNLNIAGILVSKIHYNTAQQGLTASYSRIWGTTTFAFVVVPVQAYSPEQMAFSMTFRHNLPGAVNGIRVRRWHNPDAGLGGSDYVACELKDDEKIIQNDAGYLFTGVR